VSGPYKLFAALVDQAGPVHFGFGQVGLGIFIEVVPYAFTFLKDESAIHDLEGLGINLYQLIARYSVGAVTAKGRFVFGGVFIKVSLVLRGREVISRTGPGAFELGFAFNRFAISKERDRVVALDGEAVFVEVEEGLCLGEQRERGKQRQ
jgi:hypothetical protein